MAIGKPGVQLVDNLKAHTDAYGTRKNFNKKVIILYLFRKNYNTFVFINHLTYLLVSKDELEVLSKRVENLENKISCAGRVISEHDKLPENLSAEQILIRSSNIGSVRIAQKIGIEKYKNFLNSLNLFDEINFDLEEIGKPLPFRWGKCKLATASFGHGITTTPLQLAKAYATIGNGGFEVYPSIVIKDKKKFNKKQIISSDTSKKINNILRKVVSNKEGTANFANIEGYEVGGKTGTALKSIDGTYSEKKNKYFCIFISN